MTHIIAAGALNTDFVMRGPRLPAPGETVTGGDFYQSLGGKAANQAIAAVKAGAGSVSLVSAVGNDDLGRAAICEAKRAGIASSFIEVLDNEKSGVALILVDSKGENAISVTPGACHALTISHVKALPESLFLQAQILLASLELHPQTLLALLSRAKQHGVTVLLDPAPYCQESVLAELLQYVDILTPNQTEAELITGLPVATVMEGRRAVEKLHCMGCKTVALTMGAMGCLWSGERLKAIEGMDESLNAAPRGQMQLAPARKVNAVDTTAAGDAFNGALGVALAEGQPVAEAARFAGAAASVSVTRNGASRSLPSREEIQAAYNTTPGLCSVPG